MKCEVQRPWHLGMRSEPWKLRVPFLYEVKLTLSDGPDEPEPFWSEAGLRKGSPFLFLQLVLFHFSCCHKSFEHGMSVVEATLIAGDIELGLSTWWFERERGTMSTFLLSSRVGSPSCCCCCCCCCSLPIAYCSLLYCFVELWWVRTHDAWLISL